MKDMKKFKFININDSGVAWYVKLIGWFLLWLFIVFALSMFFNLFRVNSQIGGIEMFLGILIIAFIYYKFRYKNKAKGNKQIERNLVYFIKSNSLITEDYIENTDGSKTKQIVDFVSIGYLVNGDRLIVRYMVDGSKFSSKAEDYEKELSGLFGLNLLNKKVKTSWVDYEFSLVDEERLVVDGNENHLADEFENKLGSIHLNSRTEWDYSKLPHALIAGATGGGKTFLINYFIMEFLKDKAEVFACDPKQSDLYALKRVMPKGRVGSSAGQIAGIMRKANEIMEDRYSRYIDGDEYQYGYDYLDHGLNPVVVFFDEIGAFKAITDKETSQEVYNYMTSIILKGRQMGVFMVLSTQQPNAENIPTEIRDQVGVRISLGNMSTQGYTMIFGENYDLKSVEGKGSGYLLIDGLGWETPREYEAPFIDKYNIDIMSEIDRLQNGAVDYTDELNKQHEEVLKRISEM